jgi:hypothetical protein
LFHIFSDISKGATWLFSSLRDYAPFHHDICKSVFHFSIAVKEMARHTSDLFALTVMFIDGIVIFRDVQWIYSPRPPN